MNLRTAEPVHQNQNVQNVHKRNCDEKAIESFKQRLQKIDWVELKECTDSNEVCKYFFEKFVSVYDNFFQK